MAASYPHNARLALNIQANSVLVNGLQNGVVPVNVLEMLDWTSGTNDNQINTIYYKREESIAASTTTQYDFAASLTDIYNQAFTPAEIVAIYVKNLRTTALAWLKVGPPANGFGIIGSNKGFWTAASDYDVIGPGGFYLRYDPVGVPVTAATADLFDIITSAVTGSTNSWELLVLGRLS